LATEQNSTASLKIIMGTRDKRVDAYIAEAEDFAKPILKHLRELVHKGCPDVVETMKWSMPFFMRKANLCNMAAFKEHCSFGFWQAGRFMEKAKSKEGMGQRITSLKDLPPDRELIAAIKKAVEFEAIGAKPKRKPKPTQPRAELAVPPDLDSALKKHDKARAIFEKFSPSHRREYIEWITDAKREETRVKRVQQTIEQLTEGKSRHWKYQDC
jgi:uncharacterized protein YdeI (YjbR/CyaY-like superfamily)